jgi:hypothetical protein
MAVHLSGSDYAFIDKAFGQRLGHHSSANEANFF